MSHTTEQNAAAIWYRLPLIWFSGFCLLAVLAGCVFNIMTGLQHADAGLQEIGPTAKFQIPQTDNE
ncbi:MAG: hypothetical protein ACSHXK_06080 [Oceanococcus sp.]